MPDLIPILDLDDDSESIREHGTLTDLSKDTLATVLTYENETTEPIFIDIIRAEGDTDAEFFVFIDTVQKDSFRTSVSTPTAMFQYLNKGQKIEPGSIVDVKAQHGLVPLASFRATLIGHA